MLVLIHDSNFKLILLADLLSHRNGRQCQLQALFIELKLKEGDILSRVEKWALKYLRKPYVTLIPSDKRR